jgi:hypothetical protein
MPGSLGDELAESDGLLMEGNCTIGSPRRHGGTTEPSSLNYSGFSINCLGKCCTRAHAALSSKLMLL